MGQVIPHADVGPADRGDLRLSRPQNDINPDILASGENIHPKVLELTPDTIRSVQPDINHCQIRLQSGKLIHDPNINLGLTDWFLTLNRNFYF